MNNIKNKRFGRLIVLEKLPERTKSRSIRWLCKCDCGNIRSVFSSNLLRGYTRSCGCLNKELTILRSTTHRMAGSREYNSWREMKTRCCNEKSRNYKYYGGRGITICDRWLNSFQNFYEDMGEKPKGLTIERINNNGNYKPSNCRWATRKEQGNNKRNNHILNCGRLSLTVAQWARILDIKAHILYTRIYRGWSVERTLGVVNNDKS